MTACTHNLPLYHHNKNKIPAAVAPESCLCCGHLNLPNSLGSLSVGHFELQTTFSKFKAKEKTSRAESIL